MNRLSSRLPAVVEQHQADILADWIRLQLDSGAWRAGRLQESQLREESQRFLNLLTASLRQSAQRTYPVWLAQGTGAKGPSNIRTTWPR